jgi:hypothetical protein
LGALTAAGGSGGVAQGNLLRDFAEAVVALDRPAIAAAGVRIRAALDDAAFADVAGVAAVFEALDRVADATGIPLETAKAEDTAGFRAEIGIDRFAAAGEKGRVA